MSSDEFLRIVITKVIEETIEWSFLIVLGGIAVVFWMWIDVRSLRRGSGSAFGKIRNLEKAVLGGETSDLDTKKLERKIDR